MKEHYLKAKMIAIDRYYDNPNFCNTCGEIIKVNNNKKPSVTRVKKFCNRSCASKFNNKLFIKRSRIITYCTCGKEIKNSRKYCSTKCRFDPLKENRIQLWLKGELEPLKANGQMLKWARSYILERDRYKCAQCGWSEVNKYTGNIPLTIDHTDGNYKNNKESNLRTLCPNCHSLTKFYGGANRGRGREYRKIRYHTGKSY